jgi:hypothetical protein
VHDESTALRRGIQSCMGAIYMYSTALGTEVLALGAKNTALKVDDSVLGSKEIVLGAKCYLSA